MNNACPSCGAIYNVAAKDVGRRIRCKKCSTGLIVTDAGLEVDDPDAVAAAADDGGEVEAPRKKIKKTASGESRMPAIKPMELLAKVGGIPTVLFGLGIFLVVFTGFQDAIGVANVARQQAKYDEGKADHEKQIQAINDNKDLKESDKTERIEKENKSWTSEEKSLLANRQAAGYSAKKSGYIDKYVLMFGFLLIAFGCMGYLQVGSPLLLRIVAAVILVSMVLALFKAAAGTGAGVGITAGIG